MESSWYLAKPKHPRQRQIEERLAGMDAGEYIAECRAQGMNWADIARMLTEDTGIYINPGGCSGTFLWWQKRWEYARQSA